MSKIEWEGIPEQFWPDTEKPWRASWGFGAFRDFATKAEAEAFYAQRLEEERGDWKNLVNEPFNACERAQIRNGV